MLNNKTRTIRIIYTIGAVHSLYHDLDKCALTLPTEVNDSYLPCFAFKHDFTFLTRIKYDGHEKK